MKTFLTPVIVVLLAAAAVIAETPAPETAEPVQEIPVTDKPLTEWIGDRVPTHLLRVIPSETPAHLRFAPEYIDQFEVLGGAPVPIPVADQGDLKSVLANENGFGPLRPDRCKFRPGLSLRSGAGSEQQDLLVCFACDELAVVPAGGKIEAIYAFDQPTRDTLLNLAKALLPDDEAIQELPAVRRDKAAPAPPAQSLPDPETSPGE